MRERLTFEEFPFVLSLYRVYMREQRPGADIHWVGANLMATYAKVVNQMIEDRLCVNGVPYSADWVANVWMSMRKSGPDGIRLKCEVAMSNGGVFCCFYAPRNVGPCSQDVSLDRLVPGSRGGEYTVANSVIACAKHNSSRSNQPIEEYLLGGWNLKDAAIPY